MIKINKDQRDELREICNTYDERPAQRHCLLVYKFGEIRQFTTRGENGPVIIHRPEMPEDRSSRRTVLHTGVVIGIIDNHETGITKGDLVRYYPGNAEEIESSDGIFTCYSITHHELRTVSHNVFDEDESKFLEVEKVPITDTRIN